MNYCLGERRQLWFSHPLIGDCSFDTFERYHKNPVFTGIGLWEWPVNGFLFIDPDSSHWYIYVSLYARGYVPCGSIVLMRSVDRGETWDNLGPVFDGRGLAEKYHPVDDAMASLDASVVYDDGMYHMVYGWGSLREDGGIAYAKAKRPEGPFIMDPHPIKSEYASPLVHGVYKRTYASTLVKRSNDWIILTMMSTPRNAGGLWALVALTADRPEGPYGEPQFLLYPQSKIYHPAPLEFYPAFVHDGYAYAPATSVGRNRSYQVLFRSRLEEAHQAEGWEIVEDGSCWHAVPKESEHAGIWGQTFSGQVVEGKTLWAMYPSLNKEGRGTINIASRPWMEPHRDRFVLSANNGPASSFLRRGYRTFQLESSLASTGPFALFWGWNGPVGACETPRWADSSPHELMFTSCYRLDIGDSEISVAKVGAAPDDVETIWMQSGLKLSMDRVSVAVHQDEQTCIVRLRGESFQFPLPAVDGRIGIRAERGSIVECSNFSVIGEEREAWIDLLPTEGLAGAAQCPSKWDLEKESYYRHGFGYRSTSRPGYVEETASVMKWNFRGTAFQIWAPVVSRGSIRVELDGTLLADVELTPNGKLDSRIVFEKRGLPERNYAVTVTLLDGEMRCDTCAVLL